MYYILISAKRLQVGFVVISFSSIILVLTVYVMLLFHNVYISESIEPDYQIDIITYFISSGLGFSTYLEV